jgi:hypothetical protein
MATLTTEQIYAALRGDLKNAGSKGFNDVINDGVRKTFVARHADAIYEFAHKQPDAAFWTGIKYYGSGKQSRIRFRRTAVKPPTPKVAVVKTRRRAAVAVAEPVAAE